MKFFFSDLAFFQIKIFYRKLNILSEKEINFFLVERRAEARTDIIMQYMLQQHPVQRHIQFFAVVFYNLCIMQDAILLL